MWYILYRFSDLEFNMRNVSNVLKPVTAWFNLGIQLGIPDYILSQIQRSYPNDHSRWKSEMLSYWFSNAKEQSWNVIADALENVHYCKLAYEIRGGPSKGMLECCVRVSV